MGLCIIGRCSRIDESGSKLRRGFMSVIFSHCDSRANRSSSEAMPSEAILEYDLTICKKKMIREMVRTRIRKQVLEN